MNNQNKYSTRNIIDKPARVVINGFIENKPIKLKNSLINFALRGTTQLAKVNIKI